MGMEGLAGRNEKSGVILQKNEEQIRWWYSHSVLWLVKNNKQKKDS